MRPPVLAFKPYFHSSTISTPNIDGFGHSHECDAHTLAKAIKRVLWTIWLLGQLMLMQQNIACQTSWGLPWFFVPVALDFHTPCTPVWSWFVQKQWLRQVSVAPGLRNLVESQRQISWSDAIMMKFVRMSSLIPVTYASGVSDTPNTFP